jgi:hypothetical protein
VVERQQLVLFVITAPQLHRPVGMVKKMEIDVLVLLERVLQMEQVQLQAQRCVDVNQMLSLAVITSPVLETITRQQHNVYKEHRVIHMDLILRTVGWVAKVDMFVVDEVAY